jgi:hypothetical protein
MTTPNVKLIGWMGLEPAHNLESIHHRHHAVEHDEIGVMGGYGGGEDLITLRRELVVLTSMLGT